MTQKNAIPALLAIIIFIGCNNPVTEKNKIDDDAPLFSSYKNIPGVTREEIDAIEALKNTKPFFNVGMTFGAEAFLFNGEIKGFSAVLCEWLSELFGIQFIPEIYRFSELLAGIDSYEIDFSGALTITPERQETYYMAGPIVEHTLKYFRLKDSKHITEIQKPVFALLKDSVVTDAVYLGLGEGAFTPVFIDDLEMAYEVLKSGGADAFINENDTEGLFIEYDDIVSSDFLPVYLIPIALSARNPALAPVISILQKALDNGGIEYLEHLNHIGYNDFRRAVLFSKLTEEEREFIQNNKTIPYVTQYRNYPMSFYNEREKEWQGIAFDLIEEMEMLTGISFVRAHGDEFVNWPSLLEMVETGDAAFVTELIRTEERIGRFIWPDTTLASVYLTLASRQDMRAVKLSEVHHYNTGVVKNAAQTETFKRWFPGNDMIIEFNDTQEAFSALGKGDIDLVMTDTGNLLIMTNYLELTGFKANIVFDEYSQESSFGLNPDQEILRGIMDKAFSLINIDTITENWKNRTFDYHYKLIEAQRPWLIRASILFLCVIVLLFIMFLRKKSEGRRLEELVRTRTAELNEANTAKSKFLATMSHEIRSPMNVILGITEGMLSAENLPVNIKEAFGKIFDSGHLLLNIINDILDLSKIESGKFELVPAKYETLSLINDAVNMNFMRIGIKQIQFKLIVGENIPVYMFGDELRIKQILNNILSNAFKYTKSGEVVLKFDIDSSAEIKDINDGVMFVIKVSDTGHGMTPEQLDKLFDEYSRFNTEANRATIGTGLGMSITKNLVKMMNGEIHVESAPGKGSEFTVRIPQEKIGDVLLGRETAHKLENFDVSTANRERKLKINREPMPYGKVLIVDDISSNLDVAKLLLSPYQLKIETAESGFEALDIIKSGKEYDIVFMDHMMPDMDGLETAKKIRETGYKKTIIALTANAIAGQQEFFLSNGFDGFISKPIDIRQMNETLNRYIRDKKRDQNREAVISEEPAADTPKENEEINIKGVNSQAGLALYGGNKEIYIKILRSFANKAENTIGKLRDFTKENASEESLQKYIINVHGLKGIFAGIGAEDARAIAAELEASSKAGNIDEVLAKNGLLLEVADELVASVKDWLEKNDK